jgi:hypothetical protein
MSLVVLEWFTFQPLSCLVMLNPYELMKEILQTKVLNSLSNLKECEPLCLPSLLIFVDFH